MSTFAYQPSPAAPGREGAQPAVPTQPGTAPAEGAPAPAQQSPLGALPQILIFVLPLLLFLMLRGGDKKRRQELESALKTGDTVVTQSGLIGKVVEMTEQRVKLEIAPGVTVKMLKTAITGVDGGEQKPADAAKDKPQEKKA